MRKLIFLSFFFSGCSGEDLVLDSGLPLNEDVQDIEKAHRAAKKACGGSSLPWLWDILQKAEEDRLFHSHFGNYTGWISIVPYQKRNYFYVRFAMGSGGLYAYLFDCDGVGQRELFGQEFLHFSQNAEKRNFMIYSTIDF